MPLFPFFSGQPADGLTKDPPLRLVPVLLGQPADADQDVAGKPQCTSTPAPVFVKLAQRLIKGS